MTPQHIVDEMMKADMFSQWLGIEVIAIQEGYSKIKMQVRPEMMNGLGIVHGGIAFAFSDSAFAFACKNKSRTRDAPTPTNISTNSEPEIE
jgi:acyl-CoA thioesterase